MKPERVRGLICAIVKLPFERIGLLLPPPREREDKKTLSSHAIWNEKRSLLPWCHPCSAGQNGSALCPFWCGKGTAPSAGPLVGPSPGGLAVARFQPKARFSVRRYPRTCPVIAVMPLDRIPNVGRSQLPAGTTESLQRNRWCRELSPEETVTSPAALVLRGSRPAVGLSGYPGRDRTRPV